MKQQSQIGSMHATNKNQKPGEQLEPADQQAWFRALYDDNSAALMRYVLRRLPITESAPDVVSEVFLTAWRRRDAVPRGIDGRLWLYGVARNVLANHRRAQNRHLRLTNRIGDNIATTDESDPQNQTDNQLLVHQALRRLSSDDREVLMLANWEGLRSSEIAAVLSIPDATVRTRLHRARRRLAEHLASMGIRGEQDGH